MNTWKVILATLVIFGAGVLTGGLLVNYSNKLSEHPQRVLVVEGPKHAGTNSAAAGRLVRPLLAPNFLRAKDFLERLDRELKLNAQQREHIEKIITEGQDRIKSFCQEIEPEVKEELANTREKIENELTPTQLTLFTELLKRKPAATHPATNAPSSTVTNASSAKKP